MNFTDLLKDLKARKFKPVYLLHGEESYYIDRVSDTLEHGVLSEAERGFNQTVFYGKDSDLVTILNAARRFPMMSEYQVIIVKEAQDLKWGKDAESDKQGSPLLSYLENPVPSTILVICYRNGKFDKRRKAYKAIEKKGVVFESPTIQEYKLPLWIEEYIRDKGRSIHPGAAALMAEHLGADLSKVANEADKLILNTEKDRQISAEDVQKNIGISKEFNVFELQNALAKRDAYKANQIINYFAANPKNNPLVVLLGTLGTYFAKIMKYHYLTDRSQSNLARELGVSPYFVKDYELAARNFNLGKTFQIISYLRECDLKSKGVDATGTPDGELMKELVYKILH